MKVLLVCSGGMSSAIVVKAMEKEAKTAGLNLQIKSIGTGEFEEEIKNGWDVVLVAPQVRHRLESFQASARPMNIPVSLISPQGYSPLGGAKVIEQLKSIRKLTDE